MVGSANKIPSNKCHDSEHVADRKWAESRCHGWIKKRPTEECESGNNADNYDEAETDKSCLKWS